MPQIADSDVRLHLPSMSFHQDLTALGLTGGRHGTTDIRDPDALQVAGSDARDQLPDNAAAVADAAAVRTQNHHSKFAFGVAAGVAARATDHLDPMTDDELDEWE